MADEKNSERYEETTKAVAESSDPAATWGATPEAKAEWADKHGDEESSQKNEPVVPDSSGKAPAGDANRPSSTTQGPSK